jgi:ferredoxin
MHATIQKKMDVILNYLQPEEKVFVVGCGNCAEKCKSGGPEETEEMAQRLKDKGVHVVGYSSTPSGVGLCGLPGVRTMLKEENADETLAADSFLVLACGQGIHTVIDATDGGAVHPGCDTIFGGETLKPGIIREYCSLCGECVTEFTAGICPMTLCSKQLLNGPCGGAKDGKCEVDREKDCGWLLIYQRLEKAGKIYLMEAYYEPKNYAKWNRPRSLTVKDKEATFKSLAGEHTVSRED